MSAEIATLDRVRLAADQLRKRGMKPTADRVTEMIGGGSRSTVLGHLRTLRTQPLKVEDLPHGVLEVSRAAAAEIFAAGREAEAERTRVASERLSQALEETDAQIAELDSRNAALEIRCRDAADRERTLAADLAEAKSDLRSAETANAELRRELDRERGNGHARVGETVARLEELLAKAEKSGVRGGRRPTLSLPSERGGGAKR